MVDVVTVLYSGTGVISLVAYVPQVIQLLKDKSASHSLNMPTWGMFTLSTNVTLLYAITHSTDGHFIACSAAAAVGCTSVFLLAAKQRFATLTELPLFFRKRSEKVA